MLNFNFKGIHKREGSALRKYYVMEEGGGLRHLMMVCLGVNWKLPSRPNLA